MREQDGQTEIIKELVCATGSRIISETIRKTKPQTHMLAHIRLATVGAKKYNNCHSYTGLDASGRQWMLIHNGTIYSGVELAKYLSKQSGDTDSERVFLYMLDEGFVFSTQPVDDGVWNSFSMTQVLAYSEVKCVFEGTIHKHEFVPTLDYITALDAMNI